jgi:glycogen(starch) synthase
MRIALVPSAYQPSIGGVEELTRQLALAFRSKGHKVAVFTNRWPRSLPPEEQLDGVPVHRLAFRTPFPTVRGRATYLATTELVSRRFERELTSFGADVVHVQCISSNTLYALRAHRRRRTPLVVTTQGELTMDSAGGFSRPGVLPDLLRAAAEEADVFTACSAKTLADVELFLGHPIAGARVVHNGANLAQFRDAREPPVDGAYALAIGRLVPQKGFDVLLESWSRADTGGARLRIAGDGPAGGELRALAWSLGIADRVDFVGPVGRPDVAGLFAGASLVVVPSRTDEGLPLVAVEAMASGRALLVTETGGIRELVDDGVNAVVVPRADRVALADAISALCSDPRRRAALGDAARVSVARFDWSVLADEYLAAYDVATAGG